MSPTKTAIVVLSDPQGGQEGTPGLPSLANYAADGYTIVTF